ncbi:hypothetical protein HMPREF1548_05823 [Clostridium sp. KLE 1755]|nr:hypothetical protein HMPREF1548_05823 [Clostridium sp. KLE 1755]
MYFAIQHGKIRPEEPVCLRRFFQNQTGSILRLPDFGRLNFPQLQILHQSISNTCRNLAEWRK